MRKAACVRVRLSKSLARRRQRPSQPKVRSTIQRLGRTWKPFVVSERLTISKRYACLGLDSGRCCRALIAAVSYDALQGRHSGSGRPQQKGGRVAILDVGGQHHEGVHQSERIDADVALLALDFLARIVAMRINVAPPFSALLTLWLSMIESIGVGAFPASSRTFP